MKAEYLLIGEIIKPQGIRGEVKLRQDSQDADRYRKLDQVWLKQGGAYHPVRVISGRCNGGFAYLQLDGVTDRNAAEALRGTEVYVDRAHALQLPEGEYFICDLIGLKARTEGGEPVGTLTDVITSNPNCDVYVFDTPRGEMMMPALKRAIRSVDIESNVMILDSKGLKEVGCWEDEPAERDE